MARRYKPESYGYRTVHTGNHRHLPATTDMISLAKKYGATHGYAGAEGGWIYNSQGQHIAHGWGQFWHAIGGMTILAWARANGKEIPASLDAGRSIGG